MLRLARNVLIARLAYGYISRRVAASRRADKRARVFKWAALGISAGAIYVAREPLMAMFRGLAEGLRGEDEGATPTALEYAEPPPPSAKKQRKQARQKAAARAEREEGAGQGEVHVERNAEQDLAVPLHEALKGIDTK